MKKSQVVTLWRVSILVLVTLLPFSAAFAQLPEVTTGTCDVTKMSYVTSSANISTQISPTFVDVPDMFVGFDVAEGQCVKIEFSAVLMAPTPGNIEVRALLDEGPGNTVPDLIEVSPVGPGYRTFTFIVPVESGLGPGGHQVKIQVRGNGGTLSTKKRSLTVLHN